MRRIDQLLEEYGESHQDPRNKAIHWLCVPVIVWTVVALLWSLPFPLDLAFAGFPLNWAVLVLLLAQLYYFLLSPPLALGLLAFNLAMIVLTGWIDRLAPGALWQIALLLFVLAWIGQFIGHKIEGKKPSFFKDLQFLLIGPAWLMSFLYRAGSVRY